MNDCAVVPPYSLLPVGYDLVMEHVDYELWAEFVHGLMMRHAPEARDVLELGCGTGSFALALQARGKYRYAATDQSEGMLEVARQKARARGADIQFEVADFTDFRTDPPVDAIILLYDGLNYLLEPEKVALLLRSAHAALADGGVFIFDVSTPANSENNAAYFEDRGEETEFSYVRTSRYDADKKLHVTRFELTVGGKHAVEEHVQRAYSMREMRKLIGALKWSEIHAYDGFSTAPADDKTERIHWVLKKESS